MGYQQAACPWGSLQPARTQLCRYPGRPVPSGCFYREMVECWFRTRVGEINWGVIGTEVAFGT